MSSKLQSAEQRKRTQAAAVTETSRKLAARPIVLHTNTQPHTHSLVDSVGTQAVGGGRRRAPPAISQSAIFELRAERAECATPP